jgi:DNA primase
MSEVLSLYEHYVPGLKPGSEENYIGYCPLHGEVAGKSKPSFSVNAGNGLWCCFSGCGGGGVRRFLKELGKSKDYIDKTVERLKPYLEAGSKKKSPLATRTGLFRAATPLPEKILGLFDKVPIELLDAGFDEHLLWSHDVGYDEKHHAITFPIRDITGALAGIVGRNLSPIGPKYKVYKSEIKALGFRDYSFDNHAYVWRGDRVYAKLIASQDPPVIYVTEGYKTCLWMVQNGFEDTICLMGSKLSDAQRIFLERLGGTLVLCLDNDPAGYAGTEKIGYEVHGCRVLVLSYPESVHQLDSLSHEELHGVVNNAIPYFQWRRAHAKRKSRSELPF